MYFFSMLSGVQSLLTWLPQTTLNEAPFSCCPAVSAEKPRHRCCNHHLSPVQSPTAEIEAKKTNKQNIEPKTSPPPC